jgi:aerobic carbon-monoxide dehydrogenase large subunit
MNSTNPTTKFGSGQAVHRIEDAALLQGLGRFSDDVSAPGQLHLCFTRATVAHGDITHIDVDAARAMPGVIAVYTGADLVAAGVHGLPMPSPLTRADGKPMATPLKRGLAFERVRYVGEPVVAVVATSHDAARAAADAVMVDYAELPVTIDPFKAMQNGAPVHWPAAPDNIACEMRHGKALPKPNTGWCWIW